MSHVIEPAASGRAKCRGCGDAIAKDSLRLGERLPNPFGEGDMTLWFHPRCAAYKRPEPLLEAMETATVLPEDADLLRRISAVSLQHRRLPRLDGVERSPTGRARCRACRELIEKDAWRIRLVYYEEGRFNPSGFIHARCAADYLGTADLLERAQHFSPELDEADLADLGNALGDPTG